MRGKRLSRGHENSQRLPPSLKKNKMTRISRFSVDMKAVVSDFFLGRVSFRFKLFLCESHMHRFNGVLPVLSSGILAEMCVSKKEF